MKNGPRNVTIQHWLINYTSNTSTTSNQHNSTPLSAPISLAECTGCSLHNTSSYSAQGNRTDNRLIDLPCLFQEPHAKVVNLKHLQDGLPKFHRHLIHNLNTSLFLIIPQIKNSLFPRITHASPGSVLTLDSIYIDSLPPKLMYSHNNDIISINSSPPRKVLRTIFSALNFHTLLSMDRWKDLLIFHQAKLIDWTTTWSIFSYNPFGCKSSTSFPQSTHTAFLTKLQIQELPLLTMLQFRHPELYDSSLWCFLCHNAPEDWLHLWTCSDLSNPITALLQFTVDLLECEIIARTKKPSPQLPANWKQLHCWTLPTLTTRRSSTPPLITFDYLIRGIIPNQLFELVNSFLTKKESTAVLQLVISKAIDRFRTNVWNFRCYHFAMVNDQLLPPGYVNRSRSHSSNHQQTVVRPPPPYINDFSILPTNISLSPWQSWLMQAFKSDSHWLGFHVRINSLF